MVIVFKWDKKLLRASADNKKLSEFINENEKDNISKEN